MKILKAYFDSVSRDEVEVSFRIKCAYIANLHDSQSQNESKRISSFCRRSSTSGAVAASTRLHTRCRTFPPAHVSEKIENLHAVYCEKLFLHILFSTECVRKDSSGSVTTDMKISRHSVHSNKLRSEIWRYFYEDRLIFRQNIYSDWVQKPIMSLVKRFI